MAFIKVDSPEGNVTNGTRTDLKSRPFDIVLRINFCGVTNGARTHFESRALDIVPRINISGVTESLVFK